MRFLTALVCICCCVELGLAESPGRKDSEWPVYGGDKANTKYSPLDQIRKENVSQLRIAWRWRSIDDQIQQQNPGLRPWLFEVTPLMVGGILYVSTSFGQIAAIDAATGKTVWSYDPGSYARGYPCCYGFAHRGVAYWADARVNPKDDRILIGTVDAYLLALDARTRQPITTFGTQGRVDLGQGLSRPLARNLYTISSPPVVCQDVVIMGSGLADQRGPTAETPPGDVRGFDVRTGKQLWVFHSVPEHGEFGNETWLGDSWRTPRGVGAWAPLSADDELGYVFLPFSAPSNDFYGGDRPGDNLFGDSIVALNAKTGRQIWHTSRRHITAFGTMTLPQRPLWLTSPWKENRSRR